MPSLRDQKYLRINIPARNQRALTISGRLETDSTKRLHIHDSHQILTIDSGISLLVEESIKQPLFGSMAAFIPAGVPHRSIVIGESVRFKSIYLDPDMMKNKEKGIVIFEMSRLGSALFDRIRIKKTEDIDKITQKSLDLFMDILDEDITKPARLVRLPVPNLDINKKIVNYIEENSSKRLTTDDFEKTFPYSHRHLSRRFKSDLLITIFDYLKLYRLFSAAIMLSDKKRTITEAIYECGYDSMSSFYKDFKKVFGTSPKCFRYNIRGNTPNSLSDQVG